MGWRSIPSRYTFIPKIRDGKKAIPSRVQHYPEGPPKLNPAHGFHDPELPRASTNFNKVLKVFRARAEVQDSQLGDDEVLVSKESGPGS